MTAETFKERVNLLGTFQYVEDFQASFCDLYTSCEKDQRVELRQLFRSEIIQWPNQWRDQFGQDKSPQQRRNSSRQSLIMLSARGGRGDYREDLMAIAGRYHDLLLLGVDADAFLRSIATISDESFGKTILNFADRTPEEKSLKTWHLRVLQTPHGPIVKGC